MTASARHLNASEAADRLGVSVKTLRLYEQHGMLTPGRSATGYRLYRPDEMNRAARIVALRALGLSLAQVADVLDGAADSLADALASHQITLERELQQAAGRIDKVGALRAQLASGRMPDATELNGALGQTTQPVVSFALPWPWGGEPFALREVRPLNYLVGPLGSGKTRLAMRLADVLPGAVFLGLDRMQVAGKLAAAVLAADAEAGLRTRVERALAWLEGEGATRCDALVALLASVEDEGPSMVVVDLIEQGLDHATQQALAAWLRCRAAAGARPLFVMTRSSAMLDLTLVGPNEAIILCPANHSPPQRVAPWPGAPGYEALASCLASPDVRARSDGMIAWRPAAA